MCDAPHTLRHVRKQLEQNRQRQSKAAGRKTMCTENQSRKPYVTHIENQSRKVKSLGARERCPEEEKEQEEHE
jgi:hypothetical protein